MKNIILIPTYNERDSIQGIIESIRSYAPLVQIMIIDDNSPDGTADLVREIMKKDNNVLLLNREKKEGLGAAYVYALKKVREIPDIENIMTMDADGSHDPKYIPIMFAKIKEKDLVVGSRYIRGGGVENWGFHRYALSAGGNIYSRIILGVGVHDLTAGFVCYKKSLLQKIDLDHLHASGYAYQIEFKYNCLRTGCTYEEIPIIFKERRQGKSKMSMKIVIGGIITPLRLQFSRLTGIKWQRKR